jgi:cell division protein FtsI (penicillin-binding protein 3)
MVYDPGGEEWSGARDPLADARDRSFDRREQVQGRIRLMSGLCAGAFLILAGRASIVSLFGEKPVDSPVERSTTLEAHRTDIVDRNGELLAGVVTTYDLYANVKNVWNPDDMARRISQVLPDVREERLAERLKRSRGYVLIRRDLTPRQKQAVFSLGLPEVEFVESEHRIYPRGTLAAHVLGFVGADGQGKAGVERALNERVLALGKTGEPLRLTIDMRVQYALEAELAQATAEFQAIGASGVVMDATSGEVLGVASWPTYDPNAPGDARPDAMRNRAVADVYEMGSTFKPFTVAMGLDAGRFTLANDIDTSQPLTFGAQSIHDLHPVNGRQSVAQILIHSSNIGAAQLALDVGDQTQQRYLRAFGLLDPAPLQSGDLGRPLLPKEWKPVTTATVGFGHGIAVSPLALTTAYATLANGGLRIQPTIVARTPEDPPRTYPAVSPQTARTVIALMREVVTEGTGKRADVPGYEVAGKTGSAEKAIAGGYDKTRLLSSFAAVFPASEPRYAVLILLDEPKASGKDGDATAAITAAPSVGRLITRIAPILGVAPVLDAPPAGVAIQNEEAKRRAG